MTPSKSAYTRRTALYADGSAPMAGDGVVNDRYGQDDLDRAKRDVDLRGGWLHRESDRATWSPETGWIADD